MAVVELLFGLDVMISQRGQLWIFLVRDLM